MPLRQLWVDAGDVDVLGAVSVGGVVSMDCLLPHDAETPRAVTSTVLSLLSPFFLILIINGVWLAYLHHEERLSLWRRRLLLGVLAVIYLSYMGLCRRLVRVLYCIHTSDGETETYHWTEDTSVECYTSSHAYLIAILALPLLLLLVAFPIGTGSFLLIKRHKNALSDETVKETLGFVFLAYREEVVFWDSLIILRKALVALIVVFSYPLGGSLQGLTCVFVLSLALMLHILLPPFRPPFEWLNICEAFSLMTSVLTFFSGVALDDAHIGYPMAVLISVAVVGFNVGFVLLMICTISKGGIELMRQVLSKNPKMKNTSLEQLPWYFIVYQFSFFEIPSASVRFEIMSANASAYWRVAGMSYLKYSSLCADMVRAAIKEPHKAAAKARETVYFRSTVWKDGTPEKQVITDIQEGVVQDTENNNM